MALLQAQAAALRAEIVALRDDIAAARDTLARTPAPALVEANGRLVLSVLHAAAAAETASSELEALTHASQRDPLTGVPNRTLMLDRLEGALSLARRRDTRLAILFVDLDGFKQVNDSRGHAVGDALLLAVARGVASVLRASDTVSRHGGDEFLVLLTEVAQAADAARGARKILAAVEQAAAAVSSTLRLSASVGIAIFPDHAAEPAALIARADGAMYRAKQEGGGRYAFHVGDAAPLHGAPAG